MSPRPWSRPRTNSGYDGLHRLASDTLTTAGGATVASISYGYDAGGDLTAKTTTGVAGAGTSTYTYDQAGRLTSWDNGTATTAYAYDGAGNRVRAGSVTCTFDARGQLTSDGTGSYAYSANGDLASVTGPSGTVASASDAYGQQSSQGSQSLTYDALGRDVQVAVTNGATVSLSYVGAGGQLAGDGADAYTWTPGGTLTGTAPAASPGTGVLDLTDHHTDLTGQFTAAGTALAGSRAYGPWGAVTATGGTLAGSLGYQSQYTSPATGQVDMGARWYNPATGSFGNKDTVSNKPVPDSASASPYGYAADNPLGATDPTGHMLVIPNGGYTGSPSKPKPAPKPAAKPAPLDAHQLHLLHLAHLAATGQAPVKAPAARQAAAVKAAAAKIPTYCAGGNIGALNTCMSAVYRAAGGQADASGVPKGTGYNASVASQAMSVVQKQYNAEQKTANKASGSKPASAAKPKDASATGCNSVVSRLDTPCRVVVPSGSGGGNPCGGSGVACNALNNGLIGAGSAITWFDYFKQGLHRVGRPSFLASHPLAAGAVKFGQSGLLNGVGIVAVTAGVALNYLQFRAQGDSVGKSVVKTVIATGVSTVIGSVAANAGEVIGGAVGALIPGLGETGISEAVLAAAGGLAGGYFGNSLGSWAANKLFGY